MLTQEIQDVSKPVPQEHFFNLSTTNTVMYKMS